MNKSVKTIRVLLVVMLVLLIGFLGAGCYFLFTGRISVGCIGIGFAFIGSSVLIWLLNGMPLQEVPERKTSTLRRVSGSLSATKPAAAVLTVSESKAPRKLGGIKPVEQEGGKKGRKAGKKPPVRVVEASYPVFGYRKKAGESTKANGLLELTDTCLVIQQMFPEPLEVLYEDMMDLKRSDSSVELTASYLLEGEEKKSIFVFLFGSMLLAKAFEQTLTRKDTGIRKGKEGVTR